MKFLWPASWIAAGVFIPGLFGWFAVAVLVMTGLYYLTQEG